MIFWLKKIHKKFFKKPFFAAGFLILEVMVAIYLVITGLVGSLALITFVIGTASVSSGKLIAANLAQEGLEVVRHIRDSQVSWNSWFVSPPLGSWRVQYDSATLNDLNWDRPLLYDSDTHLYQYGSGQPTSFVRKITLNRISEAELQVIAEITWIEKSRNYDLKVDSRLWNWK